jgi:hypothetical protein
LSELEQELSADDLELAKARLLIKRLEVLRKILKGNEPPELSHWKLHNPNGEYKMQDLTLRTGLQTPSSRALHSRNN